jgi:hypothetical protein
MTALSAQIPLDLSPIQEAIARFGIPNPIEYLYQADADPDPVRANADAVRMVGETANAVADDLSRARAGVIWHGDAGQAFSDVIDWFIDLCRNIADLLLGAVEFLLTALDVIIDLFRAICTILMTAAAILAAIIVAAVALAAFTLGGSLAAAAEAVWAVATTTTMTIIGLVGTVAFILKFLLDQLNKVVEWLLEQVQGIREKLA